MRAMRAEEFSGYKGLKLVDLPKPAVTDGKVLLRITAAGVTPLDHTILSGQHPRAKAPLVLGGEGAAVVEEGGGSEFPVGSRVMFTGPYGVSEDGAYGEWLAVRKEHICLIPEAIDDVTAAGVPVAYLTAHISLTLAHSRPHFPLPCHAAILFFLSSFLFFLSFLFLHISGSCSGLAAMATCLSPRDFVSTITC